MADNRLRQPAGKFLTRSCMVSGISFRQSPVTIREKVVVPEKNLHAALQFLGGQPGVRECMVLSTCNRTELYLSVEEWVDGRELFLLFARTVCELDLTALADQIYVLRGSEAVAHLLRVASGLDSLVLGETQILGQVKQAFREAENQGCVDRDLHRWVPYAFAVAKKVHATTGIGESPVSVSSAAVELAEKIFEDLSGRKAVLLGAGRMGELAATHLKGAGVSSIAVVNRTQSRAAEVAAKCSGTVVDFEKRLEVIGAADVVVCATDAPHFILNARELRNVMGTRPHRPLLVLDISVPRNVDPESADLEGLYLFSVDDLDKVVQANRERRQAESVEAERILQLALDRFLKEENRSQTGPAIAAIRNQVHSICRDELERFEQRVPSLSSEQKAEIEMMLHRIAQKIVHPAIMELKKTENRDSSFVERVFGVASERSALGF